MITFYRSNELRNSALILKNIKMIKWVFCANLSKASKTTVIAIVIIMLCPNNNNNNKHLLKINKNQNLFKKRE